MKKLFILLAISSFLCMPIAANAVSLGTGDMNLTYGGPTGGGYYLDYNGNVIDSTFGYTTGGFVEVFCVSGQDLHNANFRFYTITNEPGTGLDTVFGNGTYAKLSRAAWVANNWLTYAGGDPYTGKGEAQKAVWKIMGVMDIVGADGLDLTIYNAAMNQPLADYSNWYFAYTPAVAGDPDYQDYLTPVPEPYTIMLLGLGLIGLAGIRRKIKE